MCLERPDCIGNYRDHFGPDDCSYPGSDERLSHGSPIGRALGLKAIGVHIERLPPGRRTSWPHAEKIEEEFGFVLEGHPSVWLDGHLHPLQPGDFVALPAGTGIAHTFLNDSDADALLLVGGLASSGDNRIFYPKHPARNQACKDKGWFWEGHPERELGPHDGLPALQRPPTLDACINRFCPRSGKPVQADSLTRYRQVVVGFCNPGCRDDFAADPQAHAADRAYFDARLTG